MSLVCLCQKYFFLLTITTVFIFCLNLWPEVLSAATSLGKKRAKIAICYWIEKMLNFCKYYKIYVVLIVSSHCVNYVFVFLCLFIAQVVTVSLF